MEIFEYSLHVADAALAAKSSTILIRRAPQPWSLLVFLFRAEMILQMTSAGLSELLALEGIRMPKNAAKAAKIRGLMETTSVKENTDQNLRDRIEALLQQQEQSRGKRKRTENDEDGGEIEQERFKTNHV